MDGVPSKSMRKKQNKTARTKFISTKEGLMAALVVKEFLEYFNLEFSTSIYKKEMMQGQEHMDGSREQLIASLEFDENNVEGPLVLELLKLSKVFLKKDTRRNNSELKLTPLTESCIKPEPLCPDPQEHQNQNIIVPQMHQDASAAETLTVVPVEFKQEPPSPDGINVEFDQELPPTFNNKHVSEVGGEIKCEMCQVTFTRIHSLRRHIAVVHSGSADEQPKKSFTLKKNAMLSSKKSKVKHECDICQAKFSRPSTLSSHVDIVHKGNAPFQCDHCGKGFRSRSHKKGHVEAVHLKIKNFQCDFCSYSSYDKKLMKQHVFLVHENSSFVTCDLCELTFKGQAVLDKHKLQYHTDESFQCDFCDTTFSYECSLKRHVESHHAPVNIDVDVDVDVGDEQEKSTV